MKVSHTEVIDRPVSEVWTAFESPQLFFEWQGNLLEFEQVEGDFDEEGSVAHMRVRQTGMTNNLTVTVLRRSEHRVKYGYEGAQAPFEIANRFEDVGDGKTEWTAELEVKLNLLTRALGPVLKPIASELVKRNGRDFREFMEQS